MKLKVTSVSELTLKGTLWPTYRVSKPQYSDSQVNRYFYYSKTPNHHLYFLVKKLFKTISDNYDICLTNARDTKLIEKIDNVIELLHFDDISFTDTYKCLDMSAALLLEDNAYSNRSKTKPNVVEQVDTHYYGGGYGVKGLWAELFDLLTICEKQKILHSQDFIAYLRYLKNLIQEYGTNSYKNLKLTAADLVLADKESNFIVKPELELVTAEDIADKMAEIHAADLCHSRGLFNKMPLSVMIKTVDSFDSTRRLVLEKAKN